MVVLAASVLVAAPASAADDEPQSRAWMALRDDSLRALTALGRTTVAPSPAAPRMIVVGFTGGLEGPDSRVSGIARMRRKIEDRLGDHSGVAAFTFNNREWRPAVRAVLELAGPGSTPSPPLIIAYGHSWGGGAVTSFARALGAEGIEIALAVYIDAFSLRNPRVPSNVRYAVNLYQRVGIFRGFPLRGKSKLILESPESTVVLANLRITPDTDHFGWNWNIVQPLLYRHHHRMGHDVRLQQFLLDLIALETPTVAPTPARQASGPLLVPEDATPSGGSSPLIGAAGLSLDPIY